MAAEAEGARLKRLFANTSIYALGDLALTVIGSVSTPILTYFLLPAELGTWSLCLMLFTGLSTICGLSLQGAVTRFYYDHEHDEPARRRFQGTVLSFMLLWSVGLCTVLALLGPGLFDALFADLPFWPYGAFVVVMALFSVVGLVPKATWAAAERSKAFVGVALLGSATDVLGSLGLVMFTTLGALGLFWGRTASLFILLLPFGLWSLRHVGLAWNRTDLRAALTFSLPLVPHLLAHWVLGMSDRFLIERHYRGEADPDGLSPGLRAVGIYGTAYVFIGTVNMVAVAVNRAWVPLFTRAFGEESERPFVARSITYFVLAIVAMSVVMVVLSPSLIRWLYHEKYMEAATLAPILAFGGVFQGLYYIYVAGLFYYKRNHLVPIVTLVSGTVNVVLNLLWLPLYGLAGAAWATVIGYAVLALGMRWGCRTLTRLPFEVSRLVRLTVVMAVTTVIGVFLDGRFHIAAELGLKLALLLSMPVALHVVGFWREEELNWFRAKLPWGKRN